MVRQPPLVSGGILSGLLGEVAGRTPPASSSTPAPSVNSDVGSPLVFGSCFCCFSGGKPVAKTFSVAVPGPVGFSGGAGHVRRRAKGLIPYKRAGLGCKEGVVVVTSPVETVGRVEGRGRYTSSTSFPWCCRDRRRRRGAPDAALQDPSYNPRRRCHSSKDSAGYSGK